MITKLFKKISIFDILLTVLIVIAAFGAYSLLIRKPSYITIRVKIGDGVQAWYLNYLKKGLVQKDTLGRNSVEITNVFYYPKSPDSNVVYVDVKLQAVYSNSSKEYTFKGRPVEIGNYIRMNPGSVLIEGTITGIQGVEDKRETKHFIVDTQTFGTDLAIPNTTGVYDYLAKSINVGDEVKDSDGKVIIKVLNKTVTDAKRVVVDSAGRSYLTTDPFKKDLFLTLEVTAEKIANDYFAFNDIKVAVDSTLPIQLPHAIIYSTITTVKTMKP